MELVILKLFTDIKTRISNKFGLTRIVQVKGGIRQGGILSVIEFSKMMNELFRDVKELCLGIEYGSIFLSSLWMASFC